LGRLAYDLAPELVDHLVVVELQDLVHREIALDDLLEQHARRRHADGAALAIVGDVGYVLVILGALEVDRHHVAATRVPPRHRHVRVLQRAPLTRFLIMIEEYLYLQLPVQNSASSKLDR
jgi:hypothetical protein